MHHGRLLLATNNAGKVREYQSLLQGVPFEIVTPAQQGIVKEVDETGQTLEENATLKASAFAAESGLLTLADDSGLEVDALGGEPGPLSARYAGKGASDAERVSYLLARLRDVPLERRTARFRCVIAIARPGEVLALCPGECRGLISLTPRGDSGFGYDPVFYLPELDKTMAELPVDVKNRISHRGRAAMKARQFLNELNCR